MSYIYTNARAEGNLAKLTHGFDWKGSICGVDDAVKNEPFLFWCSPGDSTDEITLLDGICVEKCPSNDFTFHWCPGPAMPFEVRTYADSSHATQEVIVGMRRNLTEKPAYRSTEAFGYCFPHQNLVLLQGVLQRTHVASFNKQVILAAQGASDNWHFLVGVAVACIIIGYMFLFVLYHGFDKLIYGLVVATHITLLGFSSTMLYVSFHEEHNLFRTYLSQALSQAVAWMFAGLGFTVWALFALLCFNGREAMAVTIDSVKATCEVIGAVPTILLQPLVHSIVVLGALLSMIYGLAWLLSTGKIVALGEPMEQGGIQISGMHRSLEFSNYQLACIAYWMFGLVWVFETLNALGQFAISHAVVSYTCLEDQDWFLMLTGYFIGIVYHLGTLAFGGFVVACLKIVALLLSFVVRQTRDEFGVQSALGQVLCCCCMYVFICCEQVLTMVNELVYTDIALQSSGYIEAVNNVVRIAAGNPITYASIKASATIVRVLGVTMIGVGGTFLSYQLLSSSALHKQLDSVFENSSSMLVTSNILGTTIASGIVCFYVAIAFMMVFYQTTYSLMYCMLLGATPLGSNGADERPSRQLLVNKP
ncbi:unnamed protein product [Polarella glacialis]|uniref:Choline transporter-like protein n=1 Tax=Polarella glacialis TaxID=89957 RepID=A0A813EUR0_POLGL|nr:unnamed protein product [Polarella glacialis]